MSPCRQTSNEGTGGIDTHLGVSSALAGQPPSEGPAVAAAASTLPTLGFSPLGFSSYLTSSPRDKSWVSCSPSRKGLQAAA